MCKLSSLFFSFACHWLHVLYWCLVPGTWHWSSCLWKEALRLACLIRRKESLLGLVTPQKPMVMFDCNLCPHCVYLSVCVSICLYADWHMMYLCILLHARALLFLLLVQCPLHALKIISCSANQSLANVFKIVFHLQISSNNVLKVLYLSFKDDLPNTGVCFFFSSEGLNLDWKFELWMSFFLTIYLTLPCASKY